MPWNPRFIAYAAAHGRTPASMLRHDRAAYPGGCMAGFMAWIQDQWRAWRVKNSRTRDSFLTEEDHASFDAMLREATPCKT